MSGNEIAVQKRRESVALPATRLPSVLESVGENSSQRKNDYVVDNCCNSVGALVVRLGDIVHHGRLRAYPAGACSRGGLVQPFARPPNDWVVRISKTKEIWNQVV